MKKLITITLILALLLPTTVSFAADGDSPYFGKWAGIEHHSFSRYHTILHHIELSKYTTSEYFVFMLSEGGGFGQGSIQESEIYSDHWEIVEDHLRIPTSPITYVDVYYDAETDTLYTEDPKVTYVRLP